VKYKIEEQTKEIILNKMPAQAFTPPAVPAEWTFA
jgi:hypothetical protein